MKFWKEFEASVTRYQDKKGVPRPAEEAPRLRLLLLVAPRGRRDQAFAELESFVEEIQNGVLVERRFRLDGSHLPPMKLFARDFFGIHSERVATELGHKSMAAVRLKRPIPPLQVQKLNQ